MDQLYYESGYVVDGYYVYTADAESAPSSAFAVTAVIGVIKNGAVEMTSTFTQTAAISHIYGSDLFAFTEAALAVEVSRIRDNNIAADAAFAIATDVSRTRTYSSEDSAAFDIVVDNLRVRYEEAAVSAAFSMSATAEVIPGGTLVEATAALSSDFNASLQIEWIRGVSASFTSSFSQDITAVRNQFFSSDITANTEVAISPDLFKDMSADLAISASLTTPGERIIQGESTENAAFAPSLTVTIFKNSFAVLDSTATVSAVVDTTKSFVSTIASQASLAATVGRIKTSQAALASVATLTPAYLSFENKRPFSIFYKTGLPTPTTYGLTGTSTWSNGTNIISTTSPAHGSGSALVTHDSYSSQVNQIFFGKSNSGNFTFNANEDFIVTFNVKITQNYVTGGGILIGGQYASDWGIGYNYSGSQFYPTFRYNNGGSSTLVATGIGNFNTWNNWVLKRVNGRISLSINGVEKIYTNYSGQVFNNGRLYLNDSESSTNLANPIYYDDLFIASGTNAVQSYNADGSIADGTLSTTKILLNFDGNAQDITQGVYRATLALNSAATVQANVSKSVKTSASLSSTAAVNAIIGNVKPLSANMQSAGFVVAAAGRIRPFVDLEVSAFTATINASRISATSAALSATSTESCIADKVLGPVTSELTFKSDLNSSGNIIKDNQVVMQSDGFLVAATGRIRPFADIEVSTFNLTADSQVVKVVEAAVAANAALTAQATRLMSPVVVNITATTSLSTLGAALPSGTVNMAVTVNATIAANRIRGVDSAQSVTAALAAQARNIHGGVIAADSTATVSALVYKIKQFNADLTALAFELAIVSKIGNVIVDMPAAAQLTAISKITTGSVVDAVAESSLSATGVANKPAEAVMSASTEMTTDGDAGIIGEVDVTATTGMSTTAVTVQTVQANIQSESTLIATAGRIRPGISLEWGEASLTATVGVIKQAVTNVQSQASMTTVATRKVSGVASLQCQGFSLIVARVLNLEASITYRVPAERTVWRVRPEQYIWTVESENRSYKIKG